MATEARTMARWGHVAAVGRAVREQRGNVAGLGEILWRRKLVVLASVAVVLALTAAYVGTLASAYQAEALVAPGDPAGEGLGQGTFMEDQLRLIESRIMAERLVERLDLHFLPEFRPDLAPRAFRLADLLPEAIVDRLPKAWADALVPTPADGEVTDEQRAARLWQEAIAATMARIGAEVTSPPAIGVKFISEDPQLAAAGANGLAELYLEQRPSRERSATPGDRAASGQEIERLRASVRELEQAIAAARGGADAQASATSEQRRLDLTGELAFWRRERAEVEARRRQMQAALDSGVGLDQPALFVDAERLGQLQARARELQQTLAALSEQDPQVAELRAQLAALEQERRAELEQALEQSQHEIAIIQARETALAAEIEALGEQSAQGEAAGGLVVLEQRLEAERAALRERLEQTAAGLAGQPSATAPTAARVIAPAVVPSQPTYPRLTLIWGVAAAGALLLGILLAFGLEAVERARA